MIQLEKNLNLYLSNLNVLYAKLHNLHWYVSGEGFFTTHAKLEELYNITAEGIDSVAEVMLSTGLKPFASLSKYLENASIKELEAKNVKSKEAIEVVLADFKEMRELAKSILEEAEDSKQYAVVDLFSGYVAEYDKTLWMLNAFLA